MLALLVHADKKPALSKGAMVVPLARWEDAKIPLRIVRDESRALGRAPDHFVSLVTVPDAHLVAVIIGRPPDGNAGLTFVPLNELPAEDREIISTSIENFRNPNTPDLGVTWLARLVLGERLPSSALKWTKDFRLLQQGAKNATTKRT